MTIDLNCDMGEDCGADDEALMPLFTSANIACGGHAGDEASMRRTVELALRHGVAIGAHPGYPDRENFGRAVLPMEYGEIEQTVFEQVRALGRIAPLAHVKPHGALYNVSARDRSVAEAIACGVRRAAGSVLLVGLAKSMMLDAWRSLGFPVASEAFADRRYESDGTLRSRVHADALIVDPAEAARHALMLIRGGADTLCIHSDTPGSAGIAAAVRERLIRDGVRIAPRWHL